MAEPGDLEELPGTLAEADIAISATGAAGVVLTEALVRDAIDGRSGRCSCSTSRSRGDVEPTAGRAPGVTLVDIDGLRASVSVRAAETAADIERAHAIVLDEVRRFAIRRRAERLGPLFRALRERGDAAVDAELERFRSELAHLEPQEREAVTALARGVVAKLLHEPIVRLKETPGPGRRTPTLEPWPSCSGSSSPPSEAPHRHARVAARARAGARVADALTATGVETELVTITTAGDRGADPASDPPGSRACS